MTNELFMTWYQSLSTADRWAHCGSREMHAAHEHTVTFNEGSYPGVPCPGTPDLQAS
jgi:hypothetical protein